MRNALILMVVAVAAGCSPRDDVAAISRTAPAGPCSIAAAAQLSTTGLATYSEITARVPRAGRSAPGTRGLTLTCLTPGPGGTLLTVMIPGLGNGKPTPPGAYHVERPDERGFDARVAWAEAQLTVSAPARYLAVGGTVRIDSERDDVLEGSYQLALLRAPETDLRYPEHQVLWGAFRAPRSPDPTQASK